jgi:hypothetical protein
MIKNLLKKSILFFLTIFFSTMIGNVCLAIVSPPEDLPTAAETDNDPAAFVAGTKKQTEFFLKTAGFSTTMETENIVAIVIKLVLGFLGIIFVILMIFSGYQWMTAGGNEEQVKKATARIKNAVIGLIIVVFAYGITAFVFKNLSGGNSTTTLTGK